MIATVGFLLAAPPVKGMGEFGGTLALGEKLALGTKVGASAET